MTSSQLSEFSERKPKSNNKWYSDGIISVNGLVPFKYRHAMTSNSLLLLFDEIIIICFQIDYHSSTNEWNPDYYTTAEFTIIYDDTLWKEIYRQQFILTVLTDMYVLESISSRF